MSANTGAYAEVASCHCWFSLTVSGEIVKQLRAPTCYNIVGIARNYEANLGLASLLNGFGKPCSQIPFLGLE